MVCQLVHSLGIGGAEILATRIAHGLHHDYSPVFACLDGEGALAEQLRADGYPVLSLGRGGGVDLACVRRFARWLDAQKVDLIHAHQFTPFLYALMARGWHHRPPVLLTEHGRFYPDTSSWKRRLLAKALLRSTDRLVAVGNSVRQALIDVEHLPAKRIEVVYNGVPLRAPTADSRQRLRAELGVADETFVALQVARLDPIKDHTTAVAAWKLVVKAIPDAQLWIVGGGPEHDRLTDLIVKEQLIANVRLLGERPQAAGLFAAADVGLLTSVSEGIPLVLIEAMAAACPVVATDVGGVSELIHHNQQGLLAPRGDVAELAQQLLRLARLPQLRRELGAAGAQRAVLFSESAMLARYEQIYQQMLERT